MSKRRQSFLKKAIIIEIVGFEYFWHYINIKGKTSTSSNRKISTPLLRPYAQTVFKVYAKVRKSAQFENFAFFCQQN